MYTGERGKTVIDYVIEEKETKERVEIIKDKMDSDHHIFELDKRKKSRKKKRKGKR